MLIPFSSRIKLKIVVHIYPPVIRTASDAESWTISELFIAIRRVARIWKRGGGAFLKEWEKCKRPWPEFSLFLNQFHTVCPKIETKFLEKLGNSNVSSAQNQVVSKKKGLHWNWVLFFGQNRKFQRFFTPNHNIYCTTSALNFLWEGCFQFSSKIGLKSNKNVRFCILHKPMGEARARPPLATLLIAMTNYFVCWGIRTRDVEEVNF